MMVIGNTAALLESTDDLFSDAEVCSYEEEMDQEIMVESARNYDAAVEVVERIVSRRPRVSSGHSQTGSIRTWTRRPGRRLGERGRWSDARSFGRRESIPIAALIDGTAIPIK